VEIQKSYSDWQLIHPVVQFVWAYRHRVAVPCQGSHRVVGLNCSFRDAWPSSRVVWVCLSLSEYLLVLPCASLSLGPRAS
jgi:hypothetical protein